MTKTTQKTIPALLGQSSLKLDETLKELETTRAQFVNIQTEVERLRDELEKRRGRLDGAEREKSELESQIMCLRHNMEEAHAQAAQQSEEHGRKEEEMDDRIKKMEQVLEDELEQFEEMLKAKDVEVRNVMQ